MIILTIGAKLALKKRSASAQSGVLLFSRDPYPLTRAHAALSK